MQQYSSWLFSFYMHQQFQLYSCMAKSFLAVSVHVSRISKIYHLTAKKDDAYILPEIFGTCISILPGTPLSILTCACHPFNPCPHLIATGVSKRHLPLDLRSLLLWRMFRLPVDNLVARVCIYVIILSPQADFDISIFMEPAVFAITIISLRQYWRDQHSSFRSPLVNMLYRDGENARCQSHPHWPNDIL